MIKVVNNIYNYKIKLMGFAAILVVMVHSEMPGLWGLKSTFESAVDLFLLLGGFSCAGSFRKSMLDTSKTMSEKLKSFYKKRFYRIIPPYLILFSVYYIWLYVIHGNGDWAGFFKTFTFYGHFIDSNHMTLWYVPAVLLAYLILPFYMLLCEKNRMFLWMPLFIIFILIGLCAMHIMTRVPFYMFVVRLPIFLIGINLYMSKDNPNLVKFNPILLVIIAVLFVILSIYLDRPFYFNLRRICFIPLSFCVIYFIDKLSFGNKLWYWLGGFTLEIYMINDALMRDIFPMLDGCFDKTVMTIFSYILYFPVGIGLAYLYHKFLKVVVYK